jgi:hypothetical protein
VRLLAERALSQDLHEAIVRGGATDSIRWHVHLRQVVWAQVASLVIYTHPHRCTHQRIETGRGTPTPGASSAPPGTSKGSLVGIPT